MLENLLALLCSSWRTLIHYCKGKHPEMFTSPCGNSISILTALKILLRLEVSWNYCICLSDGQGGNMAALSCSQIFCCAAESRQESRWVQVWLLCCGESCQTQ